MMQSVWRGRQVRRGTKNKAATGMTLGDANGGRKPKDPRVEARAKVQGGVEAGQLKVIVRYIHFLRGVHLHVKVISAADLLPMDSNGLSDPYVKVTLVDNDKTPYKSMVHRVPYQSNTLDPEWDYGFYIGGSELSLKNTTLMFQVFDYDQWSADDDMGSCEFPLKVFDEDEQVLIRRAQKIRKKKEKDAANRLRRSASKRTVLSPAFLPSESNGSGNGAGTQKKVEDNDDDSEEEEEEEEEEGEEDAAAITKSKTQNGLPPKLGNDTEKGAASFGGFMANGRKMVSASFKSRKLDPLKYVEGFGEYFNAERKAAEKMLKRKGVFGLDKPIIMQDGNRVGKMFWYTRQKVRSARYGTAYGDLNIVYNDQSSAFMQECSALMKQAGSFMSMATLGRAVNKTGVGDFLSSKVEAAVDTGKRRAVNIVENVLGDTKDKILHGITSDRDMPGGVRKIFQTVLGVYFSDVQQEVLDELAKRLKTLSYTDTKKKQKKKDIKTTLLNIGINRTFCDYFTYKFLRKKINDTRAWLMYNELPYDKTFWGKLRSPGWWLILITKLYSGWGIQAMLYAFRLYMIDRTDEWQLFEYISNFKGIQFLTGVIAMFQGVLAFMECAGLVGKGEPHTCHTNGPGMEALALCDGSVGNIACASFIGVGFFVRIVLTWCAFYLMRRSFSFGKPIFNDSRLVGAVIEIHEIRKGMKSNLLASIYKACVGCGRDARQLVRDSMQAALQHEPTPLERFREVVRRVIEEIKENDPFWISKNAGHHTIYVRAKVVAYSVKTGLHTIYHLTGENASKDQEEVDLQKKLFTIVKLKQLQPRRLQTLIWYYDVWVFVIVLVVSIRSVTVMDLEKDDWQLFLLLYWVQCFYSVLSFPFICLIIPGVQSLICHAKQTGYDESGVLQARITRETFAKGDEEPVPRSRILTSCYPLYRGGKGVQL